MARVLSDLSSILNRSLQKVKSNKQTRQKTLNKEVAHLEQAIKNKDEEIIKLKSFIPIAKHEVNYQRTALTTQSDYDPSQQLQIKYMRLPSYPPQISYKDKYQQNCMIIAQLQAKLRMTISSSKNTEEQLRNQIEILREDLKYIKEEHDRVNDSLKIQMEHRQSERIKLIQNKYRLQIDLLNEQITSLKRDNFEKSNEITRLTEKIKKQRISNQNNCRFIENKNSELSNKLQHLCLQSKEQVRKREQALIAHFQQDFQSLHRQQAGQIKILCDRIRILKTLLQDKDMQIKQKSKSQKLQSTWTEERYQSGKKQINLSSIDKYLKH